MSAQFRDDPLLAVVVKVLVELLVLDVLAHLGFVNRHVPALRTCSVLYIAVVDRDALDDIGVVFLDFHVVYPARIGIGTNGSDLEHDVVIRSVHHPTLIRCGCNLVRASKERR